MLTADLALTEGERNVLLSNLRGWLGAITYLEYDKEEELDTMDVADFDTVDGDEEKEVKTVQELIKKLKEMF